MIKVDRFISVNEFHYSSINRKVTRNDIVDCLRQGFPLIYDSVNRGRGLALGIIKHLYEHGEASMYKLKKELNVELPAVKKILMRMEELGYVEHEKIEERRPHGKFIYSLTPMGVLVYHVVFTQKPYSWLIDDYLKRDSDEFIVNFLRKNEEILKNKGLEELFNYLFIKYARMNFEYIYREAKAYFYPTTPIVLGFLSSIVNMFISYFSLEVFKKTEPSYRGLFAYSVWYLYFPTLIPIEEEKKDFYEDAISVIGDLLDKKVLSLSEMFKLIMSYLRDIVVQAQRISLYYTLSLTLELKREIDKDAKLDELYKKLDIIGDTISEIIKAI